MQTPKTETQVKLILSGIPEVPESHRFQAEQKAKEAYIMTLLKHGDISSGRAARLLGISRLQVIDLMDIYEISLFDDLLADDLDRQVSQAKRNLEKYKK